MSMHFRDIRVDSRIGHCGKHAAECRNSIVGNVVGHMAVHGPDSGIIGSEFNIPGLT